MATLMIIASMLLVAVSLAMAEHIDELGMILYLIFLEIILENVLYLRS